MPLFVREFAVPLIAIAALVAGLLGARALLQGTALVGTVSMEEGLATCLTRSAARERFACFRAVLHRELDARDPRVILQNLDRLQMAHSSFGAFCHEMAHVLGRYWIAKGRSVGDGFRDGSNVCHSGFYHGMVERVIRGKGVDVASDFEHLSPDALKTTVPSICRPDVLGTESRNFQFQCLHGLGHAAVFAAGYRLPLALELCDTLPDDWSRHSCAGGAFMENITGAERDRRMLRTGDPHYPCTTVKETYRPDCYGMQTSWMRESGMPWDAVIRACRDAGNARLPCFQSIGRDASSNVRQEGPAQSVALCEGLQPDERERCMRGAVNALADHTWDPRYAYPFCATFSAEGMRSTCFTMTHQYLLTTLEQPRSSLEHGCSQLSSHRALCLATLQQAAS